MLRKEWLRIMMRQTDGLSDQEISQFVTVKGEDLFFNWIQT